MSLKKNSISVTSHPILCRVWSYAKGNEGVNPSDVASKSKKLYSWICSDCHYLFIATAEETLRHKGLCPNCFKKIVACNRKNIANKRYGTIADVPEIMKLWCEDNPEPHTIRRTSNIKVKIHCADCGNIVEHTVLDIYRHHLLYCKECANKRRAKNYQTTMIEKNGSCADYKEIMDVWDFEMNPCNPKEIPSGSRYIIYCKCPKCGKRWSSQAYQRRGKLALCQRCANAMAVKKRVQCRLLKRKDYKCGSGLSFADKYPHFVSWWHPTKNGDLSPYMVAPKSNKEVFWICPNGHTFKKTPHSMSGRRFCPVCRPEIHSSFIEMAIAFYLCKVTEVEQWKTIKGTRQSMDMYLPKQKTCIEYDGVRYHNNVKQSERDLRKEKLLTERDIRLLRIREWKSDVYSENIIFYDYNKWDLQGLLDNLCEKLSLSYVKVDLKRDTSDIYKKLYPKVVRNSISTKSPVLVPYWDLEANGGVTPDKVNAYSAMFFSWCCPKCGAKWKQSPIGMKRRKNLCQVCHPYDHNKGFGRYGE